MRQALDSPWGAAGVPLRLTSYVLSPTAGKSLTLLVADVDPAAVAFENKGGRSDGALETFAVITGRDSGETFTSERRLDLSLPPEVKERVAKTWLPVVRDFQLPPGIYQARLLVRDPKSGRVGSVRHEFQVEEPAKFHISTPLLTDTLQGAPGAQQPVPLARRTFTAGSRLFCAYEAYGLNASAGTPKVSAGYIVKSAAGTTLLSQPLAPLANVTPAGVGQTLVLSLQGVAPGDYELVLSVRDDGSNEAVQVREPFTVVAAQ